MILDLGMVPTQSWFLSDEVTTGNKHKCSRDGLNTLGGRDAQGRSLEWVGYGMKGEGVVI